MPRPLRPKTEADGDAARLALTYKLLVDWLNIAEARRLARGDIQRAAVAKIESELVSVTIEILKL